MKCYKRKRAIIVVIYMNEERRNDILYITQKRFNMPKICTKIQKANSKTTLSTPVY